MADDGFTVKIDEALAGEVKATAAARGVPVETFVREVLASHVSPTIGWSDDPDPAIDDRIGDETLQRGDGVAWETFRKRLKTFGQPAG